jgi:hypothetical protein
MIVPAAEGARLYPMEMPNLANYLMALPGPLTTQRDTTPLRVKDHDKIARIRSEYGALSPADLAA